MDPEIPEAEIRALASIYDRILHANLDPNSPEAKQLRIDYRRMLVDLNNRYAPSIPQEIFKYDVIKRIRRFMQ